jgi:hypothetical protein
MDSSGSELVEEVAYFLTHADNHPIKQIRFVWRISLTLLYDGSREYENENDWFLYEVFTTKGDKYYVNYMQIHYIVGDEDWLNGEIKTVSNIGCNRIVSLTWGCKKRFLEFKYMLEF